MRPLNLAMSAYERCLLVSQYLIASIFKSTNFKPEHQFKVLHSSSAARLFNQFTKTCAYVKVPVVTYYWHNYEMAEALLNVLGKSLP